MKTREEMLFNKTIASYILQAPVQRVEEWANCVFVIPQEGKPTFVSKRKFFEAFVDMRKARSQTLAIWQTSSNTYTVHNPLNGNRYQVEFGRDGVSCNCEDYKNQVAIWRKGCCKHIYRALRQWGFESLRDYEEMKRKADLRGGEHTKKENTP